MFKSSFRACLLVLVLMSPWAGFAAGLGRLTINSALGQPLQAEIDLVAVNNEEISSLAAQLGSHEAFQQAGIDYKPFFTAFNISIEPRSNGDPFIKITSPNAINEPFLNVLIELSWASGRLMREYTVLLDPVESVITEPVAPVISNDSVAAESRSDKSGAAVPQTQQTVTSKATETTPVSGNQPGTTYGPVIQGDTLSDIARQVSPDGVSLNQVLIAMFRANRDAFIEDNINLLKVGVVLHIPNQGEIAAISEAEANQEVKVHVADWRGYRNRLVVAANESTESEIIKQSDTGQISATMADDEVESKGRPGEVLRLSSGALLDDLPSPGSSGNEMPQDRLRMMEEDATARNLALEEANERIAILEKNIQDLQRLLELKNPSLAEAQMQAENILSPEPTAPELMFEAESEQMHESDSALETESIAVMSDTSEFPSGTGLNDAVDPDLIVQTGAAEPFVPSGELTPPVEEVSLMDQLMKNLTYIGAAVAFLLLGTLAIVRMRRKKAEDELAADEMGIEASMALRERMASVKAADSLASHDEIAAGSVNPDDAAVDDALDAEQVYENQHQAETNAAIDDHADKAEADIEMNAAHGWQQESEDSSIQSDDETNIDLGDGADVNEQATQSDQSDDDVEFDLDLDEPVSGESDSDTASAVSDQEEPALDLNIDDEPVLEKPEISDLAANESDNMLNLDSPEFDENDVSEEAEEKTETETEAVSYESDNDMPYDLDTSAGDAVSEPATLDESATDEHNDALDLAIDFPDVSETTTQAEAEETDEIVRDSDSSENEDKALDLELDLDTDTDSKFEPQNTNSNLLSSDSSLSDLKSEMEIPALESEEITAPVAGEKDAHWHEVETKVDLARAYLDMEDAEGAREILEEVINDGDEQQKENAKAMLSEL